MKLSIAKAVVCVVIPTLVLKNEPATAQADTLKSKLLSCPDTQAEKKRIFKEANVIYPNIFCGHEKESISYVEKFSVARKDYLIRTFKRSKKFFPKAVAILKKQNVPEEFAVLLALESGFNAGAVSGAGAVGYWQIMDNVAKEYGLRIAIKENLTAEKKNKNKLTVKDKKNHKKIKFQVDDRKNFIRSTYAAARYLKDRSRNLNGDWLLIAASYNCGVGNVWDAMEKCGKKDPTFWDIKNYLPTETRAYVMNFITLNVIFKNYENFVKNNLCFTPLTTNYIENNESIKTVDLSIKEK
ncbi:MAG: lytic transglycosylase domain-containing protein [Ferruginibacter sp.]